MDKETKHSQATICKIHDIILNLYNIKCKNTFSYAENYYFCKKISLKYDTINDWLR